MPITYNCPKPTPRKPSTGFYIQSPLLALKHSFPAFPLPGNHGTGFKATYKAFKPLQPLHPLRGCGSKALYGGCAQLETGGAFKPAPLRISCGWEFRALALNPQRWKFGWLPAKSCGGRDKDSPRPDHWGATNVTPQPSQQALRCHHPPNFKEKGVVPSSHVVFSATQVRRPKQKTLKP